MNEEYEDVTPSENMEATEKEARRRVLYFFSSHLRHPKVTTRLVGAVKAGCEVVVFANERGRVDHPILESPSVSIVRLLEKSERDTVGLKRLLILILSATFKKSPYRRTPPDVLVANSLEMLLVARFTTGLSRPRVIYDIADLHPTQYSRGILGWLIRTVEARLLKNVDALVLSSPWYFWHYYMPMTGNGCTPYLIENKVESATITCQDHRDPVPPPTLLWNGILRCDKSADLLLSALKMGPGAFMLRLAGYIDGIPSIAPSRTAHIPGLAYAGAYSEEDMGEVLEGISYVWCVDLSDGTNSDLLLPNRLYRAISGGIPVIALTDSAVGKVVSRYGFGLTLSSASPIALLEALAAVNSERYLSMREAARGKSLLALRGGEWEDMLSVKKATRAKRISCKEDPTLCLS